MTRAFAPGHITGFFAAVERDDALDTGSRGAGIVMEDGVTVEVEKSDKASVALDGETVEFDAVERVLGMCDVTARVEIETDVPVGCGFGVSGASALAVALAVNEEFSLGQEREQMAAAAHVADVLAGTGLGDVVPQSLGGVVTRIEPGAPEIGLFGEIEVEDPRVGYTVVGKLDTSDVLGDDEAMERVNKAGESALDGLLKSPSVEKLIDLSWEFALESGLATERVQDEVGEVRSAGGKASMAMLGETAFGVAGGNDEALGEFDAITEVCDEGAKVL
ncbi:MAG: pantoate kinase [Halobacteriales archaeon]|nr:pantoate kinase [Halobacteriales archaeon]